MMSLLTSSNSSKRLRAYLRHAALTDMPLWLTAGRWRHWSRVGKVQVTEHQVMLPDLPAELDGLKVTQLSDLHVGRLLEPSALGAIVRQANELGGDLMAITGDLIDLSIDVLDETIAAIQQLRAPLGVHLVLGNHDHLDDRLELVRRLERSGLSVLMNRAVELQYRHQKLLLGGIDYAHESSAMRDRIDLAFAPFADRSYALKLMLAHHPHAFDHAPAHRIDLTLAGHTHGGQFRLHRPRFSRNRRIFLQAAEARGWEGKADGRGALARGAGEGGGGGGGGGGVGLGSLGYRYSRGLYRHRGHCLFVTTGVGSWFPWRLGCPAEIASLELKCSPQ